LACPRRCLHERGRWAPSALADESTQLLRDAGAQHVASTLVETRIYLAGPVEIPRIPVPDITSVHAAAGARTYFVARQHPVAVPVVHRERLIAAVPRRTRDPAVVVTIHAWKTHLLPALRSRGLTAGTRQHERDGHCTHRHR
jgi:hypothetical protein